MIAVDSIRVLIDPSVRASGAPDLASLGGANHLCVFIRDPELSKFLPAPAFPQRLPNGLAWAKFILDIDQNGLVQAALPSPFSPQVVAVSGSRINQDTILVLLGGDPALHGHEALAPAINMIGALFLQEVKTRLTEIQASAARNAAMESRKLALALSDVHDRLATEFQRSRELSDEVARHQERLDLARHVSGVGEWQYDPQTDTVAFSAQAAEVFGFGFEATTQPMSRVLETVHPADRPSAVAAFSTAMVPHSSDAEQNTQFRLLAEDGSTRWVENRSTTFRPSEGSNITVIGISLDVTHRVLAAESLLRSEKLGAAGRLAASIAHEINNPLEGLVNLIYLARGENDIDMVRKLLAQAEVEAARVGNVARQTLAFYRDSNTPVRFDLRSTVEELLDLHGAQAAKHHIELKMRVPRMATEIDGWPGEMKQVISNLLINALHASSPSGAVWTRLHRGVNAHHLVVADPGHGIPTDTTKRIFEPFFSTRKDGGTGLGLWVTRQIVEKHRGVIRVRTNTEASRHGTVFMITLPAAGTVTLDPTETGRSLKYKWAELGSPASLCGI